MVYSSIDTQNGFDDSVGIECSFSFRTGWCVGRQTVKIGTDRSLVVISSIVGVMQENDKMSSDWMINTSADMIKTQNRFVR